MRIGECDLPSIELLSRGRAASGPHVDGALDAGLIAEA
jgi:hypothetical protein